MWDEGEAGEDDASKEWIVIDTIAPTLSIRGATGGARQSTALNLPGIVMGGDNEGGAAKAFDVTPYPLALTSTGGSGPGAGDGYSVFTIDAAGDRFMARVEPKVTWSHRQQVQSTHGKAQPSPSVITDGDGADIVLFSAKYGILVLRSSAPLHTATHSVLRHSREPAVDLQHYDYDSYRNKRAKDYALARTMRTSPHAGSPVTTFRGASSLLLPAIDPVLLEAGAVSPST